VDNIKEKVRKFWNNSPCGTRGIKIQTETKDFFEEVERKRYALEPFLSGYVQFERWKNKKGLEVGCGVGTDFLQFLRAGVDMYGIDLSEESVSLAKKRLSLYGFDSNRLAVGDCEALTFQDNSFDFVYSWGVLHHTANIENAISEIWRVVKPGGEICIMLYNKISLVALQLYILHGLLKLNLFRDINEIIANHLESPGTKAFTKKEIEKLFTNFSDLKITTIVTRYDLRYKRDKDKNDSFLPGWVGRFIPGMFGWYHIIKGKK